MLNNQNKNLVLIQDLGMLYPNTNSKEKKRFGIYKCYCGNDFKAQTRDIKNGTTKSCGCYRKLIAPSNSKLKTTHKLTNHRLYQVWSSMIKRCSNMNCNNYKYYGERGIKVCDEWLDINNFINDMDDLYVKGLTLDRIDVDGNYCKENCRWIDRNIQARNIRISRINNTSGYKGVSWHKNLNKWISKIVISNKQIHIGIFDNKESAALAYDRYININNLEHTKNFN